MLDKTDIHILDILQNNGREKRKDIAEAVGLSLSSLSERLRKLEEKGIIQGYYTKLNRKTFEYDIMAFITVVMDSSKNYSILRKKIQSTDEIIECYAVLGEGSHILKAVVKNTSELEGLLGKIQSWPGVTRTITYYVLSTIKETTKLKI